VATQAYSNDDSAIVASRLESWKVLFSSTFVAQWNALAHDCAEPNAFCESWLLAPALRQFDPQGRVQIFTIWRGGELCGLMPVTGNPRYGRWLIPHVQNWLHHNAFLGVPLVRTGYETAFWQAFLGLMDRQPGRALFAHLNGLPNDGPVVTALTHVAHTQQRRFDCVGRTSRAFLQSDLSPQAYFDEAVRAKKRKELRRQKSRLSEEGVLTFLRSDGDEGLEAWAEEFLVLEKRGWKGPNGSALGCVDATRNLFIEALKGAAFAGKLERLDLRLDGKPLAMLVNFLCAPGSFSFKTAFDEDYARFSPGVLLQIENLALLEQRDIDWCDSCAAEGHPMIDSLWADRRSVGRYSVAIGGAGRRAIFGRLLNAELARNNARASQPGQSLDDMKDRA
jgi:CelD/BcsL family acetyltransferase involved in cellulose biosynthesis